MKRPTILLLISRKALLIIGIILIITAMALFTHSITLKVMKIQNETLFGKIIAIDAGHGGIDGGTHYGDIILEKDINLAISIKLKEELINRGAIAIMTREIDDSLDDHIRNGSRHREDLNARVKIINESNADIFISIHVNYIRNQNKLGPLVFYHGSSDNSKALAEYLQTNLNNLSSYKELGIKNSEKAVPGNYYILRNTKAPGVIVETGYISNDYDRKLLLEDDHQKEIARLIGESIVQYFSKNNL
ncbi:N-acetylmuramoyl-L-alanine amidase [Alkaliphilus serpentinus]|uniref:MurNAc-LAA domain-containing protein n=1 Tax=Alkaliphilus serpentinus TaxID=1482731 RepID=A0A833HNA7_9FIRM|nr:N-acetylmuramoyl-L-alanine amidase [Alkaliphilus serpentinus]KAB3529330.1 hypothetical protein F8153_09520 [Alkaliphilus serpentinus]